MEEYQKTTCEVCNARRLLFTGRRKQKRAVAEDSPLVPTGACGIYLYDRRIVLVDPADFEIANLCVWRTNEYDYVFNQSSGRKVFLHRILMGSPADKDVDHRDGNKLDCRRQNLRVATTQENCCNRMKYKKDTASKYKGVFWAPWLLKGVATGKWRAAISHNKHRIHLGAFASEEDAARAYDDGARSLHGTFACVNFPREGERGALTSTT